MTSRLSGGCHLVREPGHPPEDVAKVIVAAGSVSTPLCLYLWLVAVTGVRRGDLCGLQICDIECDRQIRLPSRSR